MEGTVNALDDRSNSLSEDSTSTEIENPSRSQLRMWIQQHLHSGDRGMKYTAEQILPLLDRARQAFHRESTLIDLMSPITICGDIHGQFVDLKSLFRANGHPPNQTMLFLGDYVDRGPHSLEVIILLLCFKVKDPGRMFLLRGNHECANINRVYGFYDELQKRNLIQLYPEFNRVFSCMPLAARIQQRILCMHGGISQFITRMSDIRRIEKPLAHPPTNRIAMDLLWADPDINSLGYKNSVRGVSYNFGLDALEEFCVKMRIDVIVRGHQCVMNGFDRIQCNSRTRLVTLFSAPKYCGAMDNNAAVMQVRKDLSIKFSVLEVNPDKLYNAKRDFERLYVPIKDMYPKLDDFEFDLDFDPLAKSAVKVFDDIKGKASKIMKKIPRKKAKSKNKRSKCESSSNESPSSSGRENTIEPQKQETPSDRETQRILAQHSKCQKQDSKSVSDDSSSQSSDSTSLKDDSKSQQTTQKTVKPGYKIRKNSKTRKNKSKPRKNDSKSRMDTNPKPAGPKPQP